MQLLREARFGSEIAGQRELAKHQIEVIAGLRHCAAVRTPLIGQSRCCCGHFVAKGAKNLRLLCEAGIDKSFLE